jgi:TPR repeat protein
MKTDKESLSEAFGLLFRATELKYGSAFSSLGLMYEHGMFVDQNIERAFSWYKAGSDLSDPDSVNLLGVLFKEGEGLASLRKMPCVALKKVQSSVT